MESAPGWSPSAKLATAAGVAAAEAVASSTSAEMHEFFSSSSDSRSWGCWGWWERDSNQGQVGTGQVVRGWWDTKGQAQRRFYGDSCLRSSRKTHAIDDISKNDCIDCGWHQQGFTSRPKSERGDGLDFIAMNQGNIKWSGVAAFSMMRCRITPNV